MFKDRLKELRLEKGLTQKELGDIIYVSRSAICKWEMGNGIPSDVNLQSLCTFFNVKEDWLLDRHDLKTTIYKYKGLWKIVILNIFGMIFPILFTFLSCIKLRDIIIGPYEYILSELWFPTVRIIQELNLWIIIPFAFYFLTLLISFFDFFVNLDIIKRKYRRKYSYIIIISLVILCIGVFIASWFIASWLTHPEVTIY